MSTNIEPQLPIGPKKAPSIPIDGTIDNLQSMPTGAAGAEFNEWKDKAGANEIFDYFASQTLTTTIRREDLEKYLGGKTPLSSVEQALQYALTNEKDGSLPEDERKKAENRVILFLTFLQGRSVVIKSSKEKFNEVARYNEVPPLTSWTFGTAKDALGKVADGFMHATGKEKALMIAGTVALFVALKTAFDFFGRGEMRKSIRNAVGVALGIVTGGFVLGLGYEAAVKATKKTDGFATGLNLPNGFWMPEEKATLDRLNSELATQDMPMDFINDITRDTNEQKKYAFAITNIAGMTSEAFQELIETHKASGSIPDDSGKYRRRPFRNDTLTPVERWRIAKEMGESLGLIKVFGTNTEVVPLSDAEKKLTLLYWSLERSEELQKY